MIDKLNDRQSRTPQASYFILGGLKSSVLELQHKKEISLEMSLKTQRVTRTEEIEALGWAELSLCTRVGSRRRPNENAIKGFRQPSNLLVGFSMDTFPQSEWASTSYQDQTAGPRRAVYGESSDKESQPTQLACI